MDSYCVLWHCQGPWKILQRHRPSVLYNSTGCSNPDAVSRYFIFRPDSDRHLCIVVNSKHQRESDSALLKRSCERWFCWILWSLRFLHMRSRSTNYGRLPEVTPKDEAGIYPPPTKQLACTSQDFLVFHWQAMSHSTTKLMGPANSLVELLFCLSSISLMPAVLVEGMGNRTQMNLQMLLLLVRNPHHIWAARIFWHLKAWVILQTLPLNVWSCGDLGFWQVHSMSLRLYMTFDFPVW